MPELDQSSKVAAAGIAGRVYHAAALDLAGDPHVRPSRIPSRLLPGLDAAQLPISGVSHEDSAAIADVRRSGGSLSDAFRLGLRDVTAQPATVVESQKPRR